MVDEQLLCYVVRLDRGEAAETITRWLGECGTMVLFAKNSSRASCRCLSEIARASRRIPIVRIKKTTRTSTITRTLPSAALRLTDTRRAMAQKQAATK